MEEAAGSIFPPRCEPVEAPREDASLASLASIHHPFLSHRFQSRIREQRAGGEPSEGSNKDQGRAPEHGMIVLVLAAARPDRNGWALSRQHL